MVKKTKSAKSEEKGIKPKVVRTSKKKDMQKNGSWNRIEAMKYIWKSQPLKKQEQKTIELKEAKLWKK